MLLFSSRFIRLLPPPPPFRSLSHAAAAAVVVKTHPVLCVYFLSFTNWIDSEVDEEFDMEEDVYTYKEEVPSLPVRGEELSSSSSSSSDILIRFCHS